jgi:hypothetical protein
MTAFTAFDRRPAFWVAYVVLAAASLAAALRLAPIAIPIVHLDITMPREAAIDQAQRLATKYGLAPADARVAAVFNQDEQTQSYVELEGGGKSAFADLVAGKAYAPYWWDVRLFKPGVLEETTVRFRPDGGRNGFSRKVAETYVRDEGTKALAPEAALELAQARAREDWDVDFAPYRLLDQSQQTSPSGRVDHRFVFEREGALGEARIRLSLTVSGDELTEVEPFVFVPESFARRFEEMRSANDAIAFVASIAAGVLWGLGGCVLGTLWLLRKHYLLVRPSLCAGFAVGALLAATVLANAPAAWYGFSTTQDASTFWIRQIGLACAALVGAGLLLGVVFMAAEGLTRRAFGQQPQLWRVWSREAAATREIAGRTLGGYLFVPVELGLVAGFYALTNRYLGWWQPSEQLTDPNILASAVPALAPIATALQAGTMEECLFRAIPLALGALIGERFGHRRAGIATAFVLQALVFGAAHANYPGFPSYSRMVELVVPSMIWAAIFLRYGLVPTILLHALFDLTLMSVPLFLIDGAGLQRALVIVAGAIPLLVVFARRVQSGAWTALPDALRNAAWRPDVTPAAPVEHAPAPAATLDRRATLLQRGLPAIGLAGLAAWFAFTPLRADAPALRIDRDAAVAVAVDELARRGVTLGPDWTRVATTRVALEDANQRVWHAFVWREAGPAAYRSLIGNVLAPPLWEVRFARFSGDVADRAEEWRVTVTGDGKVRQVAHATPEDRPGASLPRADAQALAERALRTELHSDTASLSERAANEVQRPKRTDWVFAYADPRLDVGKGGEARVQVAIAGDEVATAGRSLFVPEAWQRAEAERAGQRQLLRILSVGLIVTVSVAALVFAVVAWSRHRSDRRTLVGMALVVALMTLAGSANNWPQHAFDLKTAEPVANQLLVVALTAVAGAAFFGLLTGLLAGVGVYYAKGQAPVSIAGRLPPWVCGVLAAFATAGIGAALASWVPPSLPEWPDLKEIDAWSPWIAAALAGVSVLPAAAVTLFLLSIFDRVTLGWTRRVGVVAALLVLLGMAVALVSGEDLAHAVVKGAIEGGTTFAFAWLLLRYDLRTVPAFVATGLVLDAVRAAALSMTPMAWIACGVTAAVAAALAWQTIALLGKQEPS